MEAFALRDYAVNDADCDERSRLEPPLVPASEPADTDARARTVEVSVVIPVKDGRWYLEQSLPVLLNQNAPWEIEVIIIDSGSTDGTRELVDVTAKSDSRVTMRRIEPGEFHHARTRNLGASMALGRYVVFLNGDAIPQGAHWLSKLVGPVARGDDGGPVASYGRQVARADADVLSICRMAYNYGPAPALKDVGSALSARSLYAFSTVACAIDTVRAPRPLFDERFPVAEDISLSQKIIDGGGRIAYVPGAVASHHHRYGYLEILRRYFDYGVIYERSAIFDAGTPVGGDGRRYLRTAAGVLRHRPFADTIRFALFFGASAIGVQLGRWHRRLPRMVCEALTIYGTCAFAESDVSSTSMTST
jgi:rhamnosyltransferase